MVAPIGETETAPLKVVIGSPLQMVCAPESVLVAVMLLTLTVRVAVSVQPAPSAPE